jgi:hypothetical protein
MFRATKGTDPLPPVAAAYSVPKASVVRLFQPTQLSGCVLWLDAADPSTLFQDSAGTVPVTTTGQTVANWKDKSVSGNNASNTTNQPTIIANAKNNLAAVNFNGASQYLNLSTDTLPTGSTQCSFFFVTQSTNTNSPGTQVFFTYGANPNTAGQNPQFYYNNGVLNTDTYGAGGLSDSVNVINTYVITSCILTTTNAAWRNGTAFTGASPSISLATGTGWASLGVGRILGTTLQYYLLGQIGEVIIYNRPVTTDERQRIEDYLAWKWDLESTLPSSNPYRAAPVYANPPFPLVPYVAYGTQKFFNPLSVSPASVWLDAADPAAFVLTGLSITQWNDRSGNGNNAVIGPNPVSNPILLTSNIGNYRTPNWPGTKPTYFRGNSTNSGTTLTAFSVFVMNATSYGSARILSLGVTGSPDFNNVLYTAAIERGGANSINSFRASSALSGVTTTLGLPMFACTVFNGSTNIFYLNGISGTPVTSTGNFGYSEYDVGSDFAEESLVPLVGTIGELIIYNAALTTAQRQQVEGYLAWKWGLQGNLPNNHPYKRWPPSP